MGGSCVHIKNGPRISLDSPEERWVRCCSSNDPKMKCRMFVFWPEVREKLDRGEKIASVIAV